MPCVLFAGIYVLALAGTVRRADPCAIGGQRARVAAVLRAGRSWSTALAALISPLDSLADQLFFMHMIQHVLLLDVVPILAIVAFDEGDPAPR